jgi:serine/threonine protein kinase
LVGYSVDGKSGARYTILKDLNVGGTFGAGFLASVQAGAEASGGAPVDGSRVFFKLLKPQPHNPSLVARELDTAEKHIKLPEHVNVARVLDVIPTNTGTTKAGAADWPLCGAVVMEMHDGGNLFQRLANVAVVPGTSRVTQRPLAEPHARYFFRKLVAAVNHLHAHKMCALASCSHVCLAIVRMPW